MKDTDNSFPIATLYDPDDTRRYLSILTGNAEARVSWATFPDGQGESHLAPQSLFGTFGEVHERLLDASDAGHGVFVTVNETDGKGRRGENVVRVRGIFVDEDGAPGQPPLDVRGLSPEPSIIVRTARGRHLYWIVRDVALEEFTPIQQAIARALGTDPAVADLPRVMRCPGFPHLKDRSKPKRVWVEEASGRTYGVRAVLEGLGVRVAEPEMLMTSRLLVSREERIWRARAYLAGLRAVQGERGDLQTFKACAALLWDFGLDLGTAWELIREWNMTNASPPWDERQLLKKLESAQRNGKHELDAALARPRSPSVERYAARPMQIPPELEELNKDWFVLDEGGRLFVCRFMEDLFPHNQRRKRLVRYSFADFKRKLEIVPVAREETAGEAWLAWTGCDGPG